MKVRMVCNSTNKEYLFDLPVDSNKILELQGDIMKREEKGYILGADVKYYDMNNKEIENIFELNKTL